jgi:VWFA-related protein
LSCRGSLCLIILLLAGAACGQQNPWTPSLKRRSAVSPASTALDLEVIVTDKAGNPEGGLQKSDFSLWDDGKPTAVEGFEISDQSSSQQVSTEIILVVDEVNASFVTVSASLNQLQNWIAQSHGRMPFPTSLVFLSESGTSQSTQPTIDGNLLSDELREHWHFVRSPGISTSSPGPFERLQICYNALLRLAQREVRVPGAKMMIWISPRWSLFADSTSMAGSQRRGFFNAAVAISDELAAARVALYAVDPVADFEEIATWKDYLKPVRTANRMEIADLGLQVLATQSGGKFVYGSNDLAGEILACVRDAGAGYTLRFEPQRAKTPDTWHDLEVKVDRPGLIARTRYGYYAEP